MSRCCRLLLPHTLLARCWMGSQPSVYAVSSWPNSYCQSELTRCCILLAFNTQHTENMSRTAAGENQGFKVSSTSGPLVLFRIKNNNNNNKQQLKRITSPFTGYKVISTTWPYSLKTYQPIKSLKKGVSSFWMNGWLMFDTRNFLYLHFHSNFVHSPHTVPDFHHKSPTSKDKLRWAEIHHELDATSQKYSFTESILVDWLLWMILVSWTPRWKSKSICTREFPIWWTFPITKWCKCRNVIIE